MLGVAEALCVHGAVICLDKEGSYVMKRRELLLSVVAGVGVAVGKLPEGYAASQFVKEIAKDADFDAEVLKSQVPVLVFFTATWSGPSKAMAPIKRHQPMLWPPDKAVVVPG